MRKNVMDHEWKVFEEYKLYFVAIGLGLVLGSIYAITVRDQQSLWLVVNQYTMQADWASGYEVVKNAFWLYAKNLLLLWLLGIWRMTHPLVIGILLFVSFSYGFTVGGFVLLYGIKGIIVSILLFGMQSSAIVAVYLYVMKWGKKFVSYDHKIGFKKYVGILGRGILIVGMVAVIDGYIQPLLVWVVRQIV